MSEQQREGIAPVQRILEVLKSPEILAFLFLCLIILPVAWAHLVRRPLTEDRQRRIAEWDETSLDDVVRIELHPLDGGGRKGQTIETSLAVTNTRAIRSIWTGLRSRHLPQSYLKNLNHWSGSRYAKLNVYTLSGSVTSFYVNWDDDIGACRFAIMSRPGDVGYEPTGLQERASDKLARTLDSVVASEKVNWRYFAGD